MAVSRHNQGLAKYWLPVLACMGFIFYASSLPGSGILPLFPFQDTAFHFFIYFLLCFLSARALKNTRTAIALKKIILWVIIFGIVYGASDEFHQSFVPDRCVSGWDLLIDSLGSIAGSLAFGVKSGFFARLKKFK